MARREPLECHRLGTRCYVPALTATVDGLPLRRRQLPSVRLTHVEAPAHGCSEGANGRPTHACALGGWGTHKTCARGAPADVEHGRATRRLSTKRGRGSCRAEEGRVSGSGGNGAAQQSARPWVISRGRCRAPLCHALGISSSPPRASSARPLASSIWSHLPDPSTTAMLSRGLRGASTALPHERGTRLRLSGTEGRRQYEKDRDAQGPQRPQWKTESMADRPLRTHAHEWRRS